MLKLSSFLQAKFNFFLYTIFGWGVIKIYMFLLCRLYFLVNKDERNSIKKSVKDALGCIKRKKDISSLIERVFSGIYSHYYEKIYISFEKKNKVVDFLTHHVSCNDIPIIKSSLIKGRGVILITGHYGAIEYIPIVLAINDIDISMIAKFKTHQLRKKGFEQAANFGIRVIDADNRGSVIKMAIHELKQNRVLITQCDEIDEWKPSGGKITSFLGKITGLDRTINLLHKRTGAEVVFGVMHRYSLNQYRFIAYSHEQMIEMTRYIPLATTGEVVLKVLEQLIYKYPEQWYEWKKYSEIINTHGLDYEEERQVTVIHSQPVLNIN